MYSWESSAKQRKNVKKTGTVIYHPDPTVKADFDAFTKVSKLNSSKHTAGRPEEVVDVRLMTDETAAVLQKPPFGFTGLLPGQAQCYRGIFKCRDVILHSRTGSGKTLAYALPIVERRLTAEASSTAPQPFMLIFVFSIELAYQTKSVLEGVYASRGITIGIAGVDSMSPPPSILIGTVESIDTVVRGEAAANQRRGGGAKRGREESAAANAEQDEASEEDEDDDHEDGSAAKPLMDVSGVRAIVVDEVDTTLGPRYSSTGRRMKDLLRCVRRANGSLTDQLVSDFRSHHYVLCGATIPNWVVKAGFLGNKKFYYQLVEVGQPKVPSQLECFLVACAPDERLARLTEVVRQHSGQRIVIFTATRRVSAVEQHLRTMGDAAVSVRSLDARKSELERVREIMEFSDGTANLIVCSDVAARGLDFPNVDLVVMDNVPAHTMAAETFVHRAGRTARVNKKGKVILLADPRADSQSVAAIEATTHVTLKRMALTKEEKSTRLQLRVGSAFAPAAPPQLHSAPAVEKATQVLARLLDSGAHALVSGLEERDDGRCVTFSYPTEHLESLKALLWKYDLRDVK